MHPRIQPASLPGTSPYQHSPCPPPPPPSSTLWNAQKEAAEYLQTSDCPEYLAKTERRLGEESERVRFYLDPSTESKVTAVLEAEMIKGQVGCIQVHNPCVVEGLVSRMSFCTVYHMEHMVRACTVV